MSKFNVSCPSGFLEFSPRHERVRQQWIKVISESFESFGFMPISTPLVEREENLLGKGGNPKEMYVLKRLLDDDGDDSHSGNALRFDHTVPLALYVARHFSDLTFPFKRYAIGPNFRGERAQKGRYRQFDQCDIDVIGNESLDFANDGLVAAVVINIFQNLNIGDFVVRMNNRKILQGFFAGLGIDSHHIKPVIDVIDDLEKIGAGKAKEQLEQLSVSHEQIAAIFLFLAITGTPEVMLEQLSALSDNEVFQQGVDELTQVMNALAAMGVQQDLYKIDLAIARGLDYYTGTVYETNLLEYPGLGSICSGGRYEDLAAVFTGKNLPGVGISIGLSRLLSQVLDAGIVKPDRSSPSEILVIPADETPEVKAKALEVASKLRKDGKSVEIYLEKKKLSKKFDYAQKLGIPECVIIGENELKSGVVTVKNMESGEQREVSW